jgi:hypothetical protein
MKQISAAPAAAAVAVASHLPLAAHAQSITVAPAAVVGAAPIPVDNPWSLLALAMGLALAAWLTLRNRQHRAFFMALWTSAIVCAGLWHSPDLRAQLAASFTNPSGETRTLIVAQIVNGGQIDGFSAEDFTNSSGVALRITAIQPPNLNQCFPAGFTQLVPPGVPPASPPPLCAVGDTIAPNGVCRVNVETICRTKAAEATAAATPTTLSVPGPGLSFVAGSTGTLTITNSGASPAINVRATVPAGSGITVSSNSCAASLPAGSSCSIILAASAAEGPTAVGIAGSNASATPTQVTVTSSVTPTTLNVPVTPLSFNAGSAALVSVTNSGTAPALDVKASIPAGSGITQSSTTCAASLAPLANCTIMLAAAAAEGPTAISFGGSNTPATVVQVTVTTPILPTTLSLSNNVVSFNTGSTFPVTITNSGTAPALGLQVSIPGGSGITVASTTCATSLAPLANCTITLAAAAAEGPTAISFGGSNTPATVVQVTVTTPILPTTLSLSGNVVSFNTGSTFPVTITNNGAAPALNVQASIPGGSGITVASTTCAASLAPLANCTITLEAAVQEGPTQVTIQGDNTNTASMSVTVTGNTDIEVGAHHINGTCGVMGIQGPGFTLTAGPSEPLPIGTTVTVTGSGVANIGVFSVTGGTATVSVLSGTSRLITLTAALPAGATIAFRTTLSISVAFTLNGVTSLPDGYTATGAKAAGSVSSTLILCSAT